jgi:hypothetical protein
MKTSHSALFQLVCCRTLTVLGLALAFAVQADARSEEADSALPILKASDTEALMKKEGQKVTVIGKCDRTGKSSGGTNFVNFENADFTLVTFKSDLGPFTDGEPADIYEGKHLSVTGVIGVYKNTPQIKLLDPEQVKTSDEAFEIPEPKAEPAPAADTTDGDEEKFKDGKAADGKEGGDKEKPKPPVDPRKYFKKPATS